MVHLYRRTLTQPHFWLCVARKDKHQFKVAALNQPSPLHGFGEQDLAQTPLQQLLEHHCLYRVCLHPMAQDGWGATSPWCSLSTHVSCRAAAPGATGKVRAVTFSLHLLPFPAFLWAFIHPGDANGLRTLPPAPAAARVAIPVGSSTIPAPYITTLQSWCSPMELDTPI